MKISNKSPWLEGHKNLSFPALNRNIVTDTVIMGGGLAGMLTAYLLAKKGHKITVIEKDIIGSGATAYTTAMISQIIDTNLSDLISMHGTEHAQVILQAGGRAIRKLAEIVKEENIDCDFEYCPAYVYASDKEQVKEIREEHAAGKQLGLKCEFNKKLDIGLHHFGVWTISKQAKFHPLKFMYGLTQACKRLGVKIFEHTEAKSIRREGNALIVEANKSTVKAKNTVVATYQPFNNPVQVLFKKGMYKTYEIEARIPKGTLKPALYWDHNNPYYYIRVDKGTNDDSLLLGGEDHRKELKIKPEKMYESLEKYLQKILPGVEYKITRKWSGPILEPSDGLPLIGEYSPNEYVATAFSGTGMIYSMISGMIISDGIANRANPYAQIFNPRRIPSLHDLYIKGRDYLQEFAGGAMKNIFK